MNRKILATLTGIAMSITLAATGCAGATGASTATQTTSQAEATTEQNGEAAEQSTDSAQADASEKGDASAQADASGDQSSSKKKPKSDSSSETTEELKTVEPSAYAGQTICGKVTAVNDSEVTVTIGTLSEKSKKDKTDANTTDSANTTDAAPSTTDAAPSEVPSTSTAPSMPDGSEMPAAPEMADGSEMPATTDQAAGNADVAMAGKPGNGQMPGKGGRSSFTSNGEQMTITIPEGLTDVEIKENYVLSITLDDSGNVTAVEVKSKGRSKPDGAGSGKPGDGQMPENGQAPGNGQTTEGGNSSGSEQTTDTSGVTQL